MALKDLMALSAEKNKKIGLSEERLLAVVPVFRQYIAFWREYPDLFIEQVLLGDNPENFKLYTYQKIFLRNAMRHKYFYATFSRGFSKSFLSILILNLRAILFPGSDLFVSSAGKEQSGSILTSKMQQLIQLIPGLKNEIDWRPGKTKTGKDDARYLFKNGSTIMVLAASERSRGQRKTCGVLEECASMDETILNEVLLPTMSVNRRLANGEYDREEVINKSQIYITTAGYRATFSYDKLVEIFIRQLLEPDVACIMGGTWKIPVYEGLQDKSFIDELKMSGTYNEASFEREFESRWSGDAENSFFMSAAFDKCRVLKMAEFEAKSGGSKSSYYVIGVDVGRFGCTTEAVVIKVVPQKNSIAFKSLVNFKSYEEEDFETQAINLKKLYFMYRPRIMAIDGNGVGAGLVDFMVKSQVDPDSGDTLPPFGVENDEDGRYKKMRTPDTIPDAMFIIKGNPALNTEIYSYMQVMLTSGKIKMLVPYNEAKVSLMSTKVGQQMDTDARESRLLPYRLTDILKDQMMNLTSENDGPNIILKQVTKRIPKDRFSALGYGLYYVKLEEDRKRKRRGKDISKLMFFNK